MLFEVTWYFIVQNRDKQEPTAFSTTDVKPDMN